MNILHNPFFSVTSGTSTGRVTLPELLAALGDDSRNLELPAVPVHSQHVLHVFLCQLAAMGIARAGKGGVAHPVEDWTDMLLALAPEHPTAWELVVEDPTQCAFFQVPSADGFSDYRAELDGIEYLEPLTIGRTHDVKRYRTADADPEQWIYALVSGQTSGGYFCPKSVEVMRMNKGTGTRTVTGVYSRLDPGTKFREDVVRLLTRDSSIADAYGFDTAGHCLLWTLPWNGATQIRLGSLHPFVVEVCRRVRIHTVGGRLVLTRGNCDEPRIAGQKELCGVVGDPWTIIVDGEELKSLSLSEAGFRAGMISQLLRRDGYRQPCLMEELPAGTDVYLELAGLARTKGKTAGFHHRVFQIPGRVARALFTMDPAVEEERHRYSRRSLMGADVCKRVRGAGLEAIECLLYPTNPSKKPRRAEHQSFELALNRFEDTELLSGVFESLDDPSDTTYEQRWVEQCLSWLRTYIAQAEGTLCPRQQLRYQARVAAERVIQTLKNSFSAKRRG